MQLSCPKCGTRDVRVSTRQGFGELIRGLFGIYPLRCRRCRARWRTSVWENGDWKYSRCPRCYRQELSYWQEDYYNADGWTQFLVNFGAHRMRCPACRYNFASFRKRKDRFEWRYPDAEGTTPEVKNEGA